jgi:predicted Zn-dependent peptidase
MITKTVLDNGIRVISEHIPHLHSASIGVWVATGSRHEKDSERGISHFIEHMLFKGTERRTARDIAREIDSVGGVLNAFTSRECTCYYAKVLDSFLPKAVDLLADILLNSLFADEEIEKERQVILQEIGMIEDTPDDLIHDLFTRNFWAGHPLGKPIIGTTESVSSFTGAMAHEYRQRRYLPGNIIISAAGRVDHDELVKLLAPFAALAPGEAEEVGSVPVPFAGIERFERDLEQVHLCLGTRGISHTHADRHAGYLMNTLLGSGMSSRLFQEIRERRGLVYSVYSYLSPHTDVGSLVIYAGAEEGRIAEVVDLTLAELKRLKREPVPAEELEAARNHFAGHMLLSLESSDNRMTRLAKTELHFGRNIPVEELLEAFRRVTEEDIMALANNLFDDSSLSLALMGRVADIPLEADRVNLS